MKDDPAHNWQAADGGKRSAGKHAGYQYEQEIADYSSDYYDTEAMRIDARHGNFSPDQAEDYRHEAIVQASIINGQHAQARRQCAQFGLCYEEQKLFTR